MSLFDFLRGSSSTKQESAGAEVAGRIPRKSTCLAEFTRALGSREDLRILDLGPTSPTNISRFTTLGHKLYSEDVLLASTNAAYQKQVDGQQVIDPDSFLRDNLQYEEGMFDAVLCWDVADFLPEPLVRPMYGRLHNIVRPGGTLLGFFHTRDAGPDVPYYRYHVVGSDALELQPGKGPRLQRIFNNRHIENLYKDFSSVKFFLARDNIREVLVVR